jgi:hypothetical protein
MSEELTSSLKNYDRFFEKFKEIDTLAVKDWKIPHICGYFAKKYKETFAKDYKFKMDKPQPSKSFEYFAIQRLGLNISTDPEVIIQYIDWVFSYKVPKAKRRFTSVSYLLTEVFSQEFKEQNLLTKKEEKIDRTTLLPNNIEWFPNSNIWRIELHISGTRR